MCASMELDDRFHDENSEWVTSQCTIFKNRGFLTIGDVMSQERIDHMREVAEGNFLNMRLLLESKNVPLGIGIKEGFKEIVQRHLNRFEMSFGMDNEIFNNAAENSTVLSIVSSILGPDFKVVNRSLVISLPGSKDQSWHTDGPHVSLTEDLPCHCLNVFVPLVNLDMSNGPTSFRPESQYYTRDLTKLYMRAFMTKKLKTIESPCLEKGSILMFDYRVLHRGLANNSVEPRPVLVITFAKPWFNDVLNYPKKSVYDQDISAPDSIVASLKGCLQ